MVARLRRPLSAPRYRTFASEAEPTPPAEMQVAELREELKALGIPPSRRRKPALVEALEKARSEKSEVGGGDVSDVSETEGYGARRRTRTRREEEHDTRRGCTS